MRFKHPICITSMYNVGCTFLDWSLLYLSGQTHYCHADSNQILALPETPLTKLNAHAYQKNHPHGIERCQQVIAKLQEQKNLAVTSFYPGPPILGIIQQQLGYSNADLHRPGIAKKILDLQYSDYMLMLKDFFDRDLGVIYVAMDPSFVAFTAIPRGQDRLSWSGELSQSVDASQMEFHEIFYKEKDLHWHQPAEEHIWDRRERWALEMNPLEISHPNNITGFKEPHFWIDCRDLWYRGDIVIPTALDFLELSLDRERFEKWKPIYHDWRKLSNKNIEFMVNLDHIVKSIVMGWFYQLPDLTTYQEAVIQHCLIYQHNLNVKTWQLSKFPNNTQALHDLLEPNIHILN